MSEDGRHGRMTLSPKGREQLVAVPSIGRASEVIPRRAAPEADATRDLYERYARQIYSYCLHQLGNREEAEDATQSTFLNAFRGFKRGVDPEFESAWLYKIAQNVCLTRQRSSSRRRKVEAPGDLEAMQDYVPAHQADSDELIRLPEALESMPEQQRKALLLREWQGLSYKEIADELDLSQAAVETLLFRARRSLASGLVEAPPKKTRAAKRLRRSSDAGSVLAIVKSILFTGGVKVAATVATVAATSVVAATPVTRHAVEDVVTPGHDRPAPAHVGAKPAAKKLASAAPVSLASKHTSPPSAGSAHPATHTKHRGVLQRMHKAAASVSFIRIHASRTTVDPAASTAATHPAPAPAAPVVAQPVQVDPVPAPAVTQPPVTPPAVDKQSPAGTEPSPGATPGEQSKKDDAKKDDAKSEGKTDAATHDGA